jgi:hypothetical protein
VRLATVAAEGISGQLMRVLPSYAPGISERSEHINQAGLGSAPRGIVPASGPPATQIMQKQK